MKHVAGARSIPVHVKAEVMRQTVRIDFGFWGCSKEFRNSESGDRGFSQNTAWKEEKEKKKRTIQLS